MKLPFLSVLCFGLLMLFSCNANNDSNPDKKTLSHQGIVPQRAPLLSQLTARFEDHKVLYILDPRHRPKENRYFHYTSLVEYDNEAGKSLKVVTYIDETPNTLLIYHNFNNVRLYQIISVMEFKDGLEYSVKIGGMSNTIIKLYSPNRGICFILPDKWFDEIMYVVPSVL